MTCNAKTKFEMVLASFKKNQNSSRRVTVLCVGAFDSLMDSLLHGGLRVSDQNPLSSQPAWSKLLLVERCLPIVREFVSSYSTFEPFALGQ